MVCCKKQKKEEKKYYHPAETVEVGVLLTFVGGFLDAYSYNSRGEVFATAQTGNMVFLSIMIATGQFNKIVEYIIPILAYFIGVLLTEFIKHRLEKLKKHIQWQHIIVLIEAILLFVIGFLPPSLVPNIVVNTIVSIICSMQVDCFRKLKGLPYATTMCTGNLRSSGEHLFNWMNKKDIESFKKFGLYIVIIIVFTIGAIIGTLTTTIEKIAEKSVWICTFVLITVFIILIVERHYELIREKTIEHTHSLLNENTVTTSIRNSVEYNNIAKDNLITIATVSENHINTSDFFTVKEDKNEEEIEVFSNTLENINKEP